jgi:hypothetical protein
MAGPVKKPKTLGRCLDVDLVLDSVAGDRHAPRPSGLTPARPRLGFRFGLQPGQAGAARERILE